MDRLSRDETCSQKILALGNFQPNNKQMDLGLHGLDFI